MDRPSAADDRGPQLIATGLTTAILATYAVGMRFWSRKMSKVNLWWDDWIILLSLVGSLSLSHSFGHDRRP